MNERMTCRVSDRPRLSSVLDGPSQGLRSGTDTSEVKSCSPKPSRVTAAIGRDAVRTSGRLPITMVANGGTPTVGPPGLLAADRPVPGLARQIVETESCRVGRQPVEGRVVLIRER